MGRMTRREALKLSAAGVAGAGIYKGAEELLPSISRAQAPVSIDAGKLDEVHKSLGKWVLLSPQKLGGGTHAVDLSTGRGLAWISYWNYGDTCPISHHLAAYPSDDPYKGFEFINSTQGGENVLIYGIPTRIKQMGLLEKTGEGNHLYRVRYDGKQMELIEDVAESTGIGLGVHTMIYPDATGFS
ncbi:MAG: twin-arginine translocation signal domain-containing protein [Planctomycetes bacterium]|nr:twin-arginine translocation signal domain-containing protein [Planctomycetota bacterium]